LTVCLASTALAMIGPFHVTAQAATAVSTPIPVTSSIGVPDRGDTALAFDGNLGTETYTTPSNTLDDPAYLQFGFDSTPVNRLRLYKDNYVGPHDLTIQYTTDTGPLTGRSWTNVSGLANGFGGTELLNATSVGAGGTVAADVHDSFAGDGWGSLTFDTVVATGLRIAFNQGHPCCNHYHVFELEVHHVDDDAPTTSVALDPAAPDGDNDWYTDVHATVSATDSDLSAIVEVRCVLDPVSPPSGFDDLPAGCAYGGSGADVTADGHHALYAASKDAAGHTSVASSSFSLDATAPTVDCAASLPSFTLGSAGGDISASVIDGTSGPVNGTVSEPADVSAAGRRSATLSGFDNAGNSADAGCDYLVRYQMLGVEALDGTSWRRGRRIEFTVLLADADGDPISDAAAQAVARACNLTAELDDLGPRCASYSARHDQFRIVIKTTRSMSVPSIHTVTVEARAGADLLNQATANVQLTR
jgi:hypothetical protein